MDEERGFQPIGGLLPKIEPLLSNTASTPTAPRNPSGTTGMAAPARKGSSSTGQQRGGTGVAVRTVGAIAETDRNLAALLERSANCLVSWEMQDVIGPDGQWEMTVRVPSYADPSPAYRQAYEEATAPLPLPEIMKSLGKLRLLTSSKSDTDVDIKLQIAAYAEQILEYPADVARYVLSTQHKHSKWWPAWSEIGARLDLHNRQRHALAPQTPQETR